MSFLSPKKSSKPPVQQITSTQPAAPTIDPELDQNIVAPGKAALLTDVTNTKLIDDTRRRANLLGSAATALG